MFDAIAAAVDWSAVYLALAEVAILVAGLWVAYRGTKAILRFVLSSNDRGWDYGQGDPDWETEQAAYAAALDKEGSDSFWEGYTAEHDAEDRAAAGLPPNEAFLGPDENDGLDWDAFNEEEARKMSVRAGKEWE